MVKSFFKILIFAGISVLMILIFLAVLGSFGRKSPSQTYLYPSFFKKASRLRAAPSVAPEATPWPSIPTSVPSPLPLTQTTEDNSKVPPPSAPAPQPTQRTSDAVAVHTDNRMEKGMAKDSMSTGGMSTVSTDRLIIKTGTLAMVVKNVANVVDTIANYAAAHGGFVVSSNHYEQAGVPYATMIIRLPVKEFAQGMKEVKELGVVKNERVEGQDVTEEFVDLKAKLRNTRAIEEQLLQIMKQSRSVADVLAVQRELGATRERIEQLEGRIEYLKQSTVLATLNVQLSTDLSVVSIVDRETSIWKPSATIKEALRQLIAVGKMIAQGIIWLVIFIPVWLGAILLWWLMRKIYRRAQKPVVENGRGENQRIV